MISCCAMCLRHSEPEINGYVSFDYRYYAVRESKTVKRESVLRLEAPRGEEVLTLVALNLIKVPTAAATKTSVRRPMLFSPFWATVARLRESALALALRWLACWKNSSLSSSIRQEEEKPRPQGVIFCFFYSSSELRS